MPDLTSVWQGAPTAGDARVADDVELASAGKTVELGHLIAAHAIRYVVVVGGLAPDVPGLQQPKPDSPPVSVVAALDAQADLRQLPTEGGYEVYIDPEYVAPSLARGVHAPGGNGLEIAAELVGWVVFAAIRRRARPTPIRSPVAVVSGTPQTRLGDGSRCQCRPGAPGHAARSPRGRCRFHRCRPWVTKRHDLCSRLSSSPRW